MCILSINLILFESANIFALCRKSRRNLWLKLHKIWCKSMPEFESQNKDSCKLNYIYYHCFISIIIFNVLSDFEINSICTLDWPSTIAWCESDPSANPEISGQSWSLFALKNCCVKLKFCQQIRREIVTTELNSRKILRNWTLVKISENLFFFFLHLKQKLWIVQTWKLKILKTLHGDTSYKFSLRFWYTCQWRATATVTIVCVLLFV